MIPGGGGNAEAQSGFLVITNAGRDAIERCSRWPL
jgi:hypothetical protein